jgi:hypothetical protein
MAQETVWDCRDLRTKIVALPTDIPVNVKIL